MHSQLLMNCIPHWYMSVCLCHFVVWLKKYQAGLYSRWTASRFVGHAHRACLFALVSKRLWTCVIALSRRQLLDAHTQCGLDTKQLWGDDTAFTIQLESVCQYDMCNPNFNCISVGCRILLSQSVNFTVLSRPTTRPALSIGERWKRWWHGWSPFGHQFLYSP